MVFLVILEFRDTKNGFLVEFWSRKYVPGFFNIGFLPTTNFKQEWTSSICSKSYALKLLFQSANMMRNSKMQIIIKNFSRKFFFKFYQILEYPGIARDIPQNKAIVYNRILELELEVLILFETLYSRIKDPALLSRFVLTVKPL